MKKIFFIITTFLFILNFACVKNNLINAKLVRDCTGTYLEIGGKDYQVCNLEKVNSFTNGAQVEVAFHKISGCNGSAMDAVVCMMLHASEGWIEIEKIK